MPRLALTAAALAALLACSPAAAQTWSGAAGTGHWSLGGPAGNWSGAAAPSSGPSTAVAFAGASQLATTQDVATPLVLNALTFQPGAGAFAVAFNELRFGGATNALTQDAASNVAITAPVSYDGSGSIGGTGAGSLSLSSLHVRQGTLTVNHSVTVGGLTLGVEGGAAAAVSTGTSVLTLARDVTFVRLAEAHAAGLVHRDVKPGNVIVARLGGVCDVAKLLDFGLVLDESAAGGGDRLTQAGVVLGTPAYMPPEQAAGEAVDARGDVYALGAVAYYALTGRPPHAGRTARQVMAAVLSEPVPPLDGAPADLAAVVARCLAKDPADRFPTAAELDRALAGCGVRGRLVGRAGGRVVSAWHRGRGGAAGRGDPHGGVSLPSDAEVTAGTTYGVADRVDGGRWNQEGITSAYRWRY